MAALDPPSLRRESVAVAVIVAFWTALSFVATAFSGLQTAVRAAGIVVALGYVAVRGVTLARSQSVLALPLPSDPGDILRENVRLLRGVGAWFLAALLVQPLADVIFFQLVPVPRGLRGNAASFFDAVGFVLAATGVVTVVLYAIAVGVARIERTGGVSDGAADHADDPAGEG